MKKNYLFSKVRSAYISSKRKYIMNIKIILNKLIIKYIDIFNIYVIKEYL